MVTTSGVNHGCRFDHSIYFASISKKFLSFIFLPFPILLAQLYYNSDIGICQGVDLMFYERLLETCAIKGLTVTGLLKELGLSTSKGTAWKNGSIPKGNTLNKIAERLEVSTDFLLGITDIAMINDKPDKLSNKEQYLISLFRQLSPYEQGNIIGRAETFVELHEAAFKEERA